MSQADLIVAGAGSAGCMLASRLAREYGLRVLMVEPPSLPAARIDRERPARWLNLLGSGDDWDLQTLPNSGLAGRRLSWPRGRGLGGSSRINAMIWFPPTEHDLQMLVRSSGKRWTGSELLGAYESTRTDVGPEPPRWLSDSSLRFMDSVADLPDASPMVYQRVNRRGRRWNPARLLDQRENHQPYGRVDVIRATVDRVLWKDDRAIGVRIVDGSSASDLLATHGVVLCAGTIASPMILLRSGIGPREELTRHKIDVRIEHPNVGKNLQDHLIMPVILETKSKNVFGTQPAAGDIARWQTVGQGPISSNIAECGGLFCDDRFQVHVTPTNYLTFPQQADAPVMTIGVNATQPLSRGCITLDSVDPHAAARIEAGYLHDKSDLAQTIEAVRLARLIATSTPLADWIKTETLPGAKRIGDTSIAKSIVRYAQTLYHPVGTCHVGEQSDSVVDPAFAVRGSQRLWVVDASILPRLTRGNPSATVMTLAQMASRHISGDIEN